MNTVGEILATVSLVACSNHQRARTPLEDDVGLFCRAWETNGRPKRISELAENLARQIKSSELLEAFAALPAEPDPHSFEQLRTLVHKVGVTSCPTLDWMETYAVPRAVAPRPATLVFAIPARGDVSVIDGGGPPRTLPTAEVEQVVRATFTRDHATSVVVTAEPVVAFKRILDVLDLARSQGLLRLSIGLEAANVYALDVPASSDVAEVLVITVQDNGRVTVRGKVSSDAELDDVLRAEASRSPLERVLVFSGESTPFGAVVGIMARAKRDGLNRFAIGVAAKR